MKTSVLIWPWLLWLKVFMETPINSELPNVSLMTIIVVITKITGVPRLIEDS